MPLARYIEENLDHLVEEWTGFARTRLPAAETMDELALQNGAALILRSIASDMRTPQSGEEQKRVGGGLPIAPEAANLRDICSEIVEGFELSHPGNEIRREFQGDLAGAWDAERIKELVANLTNNALDYGAADEPIVVAAHGEGDEVVLSVHNQGPAIPAEQRQTLFDPFIRSAVAEPDGARKSHESAGLGLFIVKHVAEAHGGSVEMASDESAGTTFTVRLPRWADPQAPSPSKWKPRGAQSSRESVTDAG